MRTDGGSKQSNAASNRLPLASRSRTRSKYSSCTLGQGARFVPRRGEALSADLSYFGVLVASLPIGAYILNYNGVGDRLPDCLAEVRVQRELPAALHLLQKVRPNRGGERAAGR